MRASFASDRGARIEDVVGVQRGLDAPVEFHRLGPELALQPWPLEPADAVFAGDRAAEADGQVHDLAERLLGPLRHRRRRRGRRRSAGGCCRRRRARSPRSSGRASSAIFSTPLTPGRPARATGRRRPRAAATLRLHGGDGEPARGDERLALVGIVGREHFRRTVFGEHPGHVLGVLGACGPRSSVAATIIAAALRSSPILQLVLDGVDRDGVHELQHRRPDLAGDRDDGVRGGRHRVERRDHGAAAGAGRAAAAASPR